MPNGFIWLLITAMLVAVGFGIWHTQSELRASPDWPATPGVISVARVVAGSDGSLDPSGQWFEIEIAYTYSVEGVAYTGKRLRIVAQHYADEAAGQAALQGFAVGATVPVFYDPGKPAASVLLRN